MSSRSRDHAKKSVATFCRREFVSVPVDVTVSEAIKIIRTAGPRGSIFYVYVLGDEQNLRGVVSLRNLLMAADHEPVSEVLSQKVVSMDENTNVQTACQLFSQSKFLSLPVVDSAGKFLGVVHAHELVEQSDLPVNALFEERSRGELYELLGIQSEDSRRSPLKQAAHRFPWLILNVVGGIFSALFIHLLGGKLENAVLYLAFVPVMLVISESIGMQTASMVIANLRATTRLRSRTLLFKETVTSLILGSFCATVLAGGLFLWEHSWKLSAAVGSTILVASLCVSFMGNSIPVIFKRVKVDPRVAAGPVVLALSDCLTLLLYLILAVVFSK